MKFNYEFGGHDEDHGPYGIEHVGSEWYTYEASDSDIEKLLIKYVKHDYGYWNAEDFVQANFDTLCDEYYDALHDDLESKAKEEYDNER